MKKLKLGVTGSRYGLSPDQKVFAHVWLSKSLWNKDYKIVEFHHGDCVGVDEQMCAMIRELHPDTIVIAHPPAYDKLRAWVKSDQAKKPKEYLKRNRIIVNSIDMLLAFPFEMHNQKRSGTWSTIRYAKQQGKRVGIFYPDGSKEMVS